MATALDIITDALVWRGVLAEGRAPDAKMTLSAMNVLRSLYLDLIGSGALGQLRDVTVTADYTAAPQDRVINTGVPPVNVTLPETVDSYSWDGAIQPMNRAVIVLVQEDAGSWIYNASIALWQRVEGMDTLDDAPLSNDLREGLTAAVCLRLRYPGLPIDATAVRAEQRFSQALTHHYTEQRRDYAPYRPYCDYLPEWS